MKPFSAYAKHNDIPNQSRYLKKRPFIIKKQFSCLLFLAACLTLDLMLVAADCYYREYKETGNIANRPGLAVGCVLIIVLLIQVFFLLVHREPENGSVIVAEINSAGIPSELHEVSENALIQLCRSDYEMEYNVEYWPDLRKYLSSVMTVENDDKKQAASLLQIGDELKQRTGSNNMAMLEYTSDTQWKAELVSLIALPSAVDGARKVLQENHNKSLVFQNIRELLEWESCLPESLRSDFRQRVIEFIRTREATRHRFFH